MQTEELKEIKVETLLVEIVPLNKILDKFETVEIGNVSIIKPENVEVSVFERAGLFIHENTEKAKMMAKFIGWAISCASSIIYIMNFFKERTTNKNV